MRLTTTLNSVPGHVDRGVLLVQQQRGEGVEQHRRRLWRVDLGGGGGYPGLDERHSPCRDGLPMVKPFPLFKSTGQTYILHPVRIFKP